jgi:hypothetical protein
MYDTLSKGKIFERQYSYPPMFIPSNALIFLTMTVSNDACVLILQAAGCDDIRLKFLREKLLANELILLCNESKRIVDVTLNKWSQLPIRGNHFHRGQTGDKSSVGPVLPFTPFSK